MTTFQRAVVIQAYGGAHAAQIEQIEKQAPEQGQVRVRIRAAGVNGIDWKVREGQVR